MSKAKTKFSLPKRLTLNYKTWRCGEDEGRNNFGRAHGTGGTSLLNNSGYKCCLGQFCSQAGVPGKRMNGVPQPSDLDWNGMSIEVKGMNLKLEQEAIDINDESSTTIAEKVTALRKLFKKHGRTIVAKNFPKGMLK